ncbi:MULTISPECIES: hydroxyphenylacetyl-CoA thioesterase PaaI [Variovorax]|jgi:acyl-CoA thioesterase|uniref:hydroxyphenylacetyl-CoA thioesterase PaaI n=1 Tax=Variovorax TaxID=34072 RepID=UPI00092C037C|nr:MULTISPECIES: hydroxyphenylacetyl-CoA thioesterase PaaI [Variovorax]OJZ15870.1 MAG: phenylacetic acid degradation protein PaaD [Variovorax sp. 67-131]UKI08694.1 hydroxyphenylacetyl-CoA thioesterase PaaI [Variovorax paradoxus]
MSGEEERRMAESCAQLMSASDKTLQRFGMTVDAIGPGTARLSMEFDETAVNGFGMAHGGLIFLLADSAFAYACNSRNHMAVGQFCTIAFIKAGLNRGRYTATAEERSLTGRSGIYDVAVRDADHQLIAEFRGHSRLIEGTHFPQ